MSADRELLELAAKAAGAKWIDECWPEDLPGLILDFGKGTTTWNPLEHDGDALRLAVKLGLLVDCLNAMAIRSERKSQGHNDWIYGDEDMELDEDAAARRAIVLAAAEIGRAL